MKQILVVDDDPSILSCLLLLLQSEGFNALGASSGREALSFIERGCSPGLILCDLIMSEMSGGQFLTEFFLKRGPGVPVILMSGLCPPPLIPGVTRFLPKPFDTETLVQLAHQYCPQGAPLITLRARSFLDPTPARSY